MTTNKIGLFVETTPIWPDCESDPETPEGQWLFAVNLTCGYLNAKPYSPRLADVQPWRWEILSWVGYLVTPDTDPAKAPAVQPIDKELSVVDDLPDHLKLLDGNQWVPLLESLAGQGAENYVIPTGAEAIEIDNDGGIVPAHGLMGQASQWPAPLGATANLSILLRLTIDDKTAQSINERTILAVAPVYKVASTTFTPMGQPGVEESGRFGIGTDYEPVDGFKRRAYLGGVPLKSRPDPGKVLYDPSNYFVRKATQCPGTWSGDPVRQVVLSLPALFDLCDILLRATLGKALGNTPLGPVQISRDLMLKLLAARVAPVPDPNDPNHPNGSTVQQLLWACSRDDAGGSIPDDNIRTLFELLGNWWKRIEPADLAALFVRVAPIPDGNMPEPAQGRREWLEAWSRVHAEFVSEQGSENLLRAQWRGAVDWGVTLENGEREKLNHLLNRIEPILKKVVFPVFRTADAVAEDFAAGFVGKVLPGRQEAQSESCGSFRDTVIGLSVDGLKKLRDQIGIDKTLVSDKELCDHAAVTIDAALATVVNESVRPTPTPHPLVVQVAPIHREEDADDPGSDVSANISGYGILIRRSSGAHGHRPIDQKHWRPWRFLNLSVPQKLDEHGKVTSLKSAESKDLAVPLPMELGYDHGVRSALLSYDEVQLADGLAVDDGLQDGNPTQALRFDEPFDDAGQFHDIYANYKEWAKLPPLGYGAWYEIVPFVMGPGGVLPPALRAKGTTNDPRVLADHSAGPELADLPTPDKRIASHYLRRVPVGALGIVEPDDNYKKSRKAAGKVDTIGAAATAQPVPMDSSDPPRDWRSARNGVSARPSSPSPGDEAHGDLPPDLPPVLLITRASVYDMVPEAVAFTVRAPYTDIRTFGRWYGLQAPGSVELARWLGNVEAAHERLTTIQNARNRDVQDPAISALLAELVPVKASEGAEPIISLISEWSAPATVPVTDVDADTPEETLAKIVQTTWREDVSVGIEVADGPRLSFTGRTLHVTIPRGEVWEFRLYPALYKALFARDGDDCRFYPGLEVDSISYADHIAITPQRWTIEAITEELPADQAVHTSMRPVLVGDDLLVMVDRTGSSQDPWDNVGLVTLEYQAFVWSGRTLPPFPFPADPHANTLDVFPQADTPPFANAMVWDVAGFENQEAASPRRQTAALPLGADGMPIRVTTLDGRNRGALYYRFKATVRHRYESLWKSMDGATRTSKLVNQDEEAQSTVWKRFFVPARPANRPATPSISFVVPLTEPHPGHTHCDVLAHLEEPWLDSGGLAEVLEARVEVIHRRTGQHVNKSRPNFAPVPIQSAGSLDSKQVFVPLETVGVLGHTFDLGSATPKIVAASAAVAIREEGLEYADYMGSIRFRRVLHPLGEIGWNQSTASDELDRDKVFSWTLDQVPESEMVINIGGKDRLKIVRKVNGLSLSKPDGTHDPDVIHSISELSAEDASRTRLYLAFHRLGDALGDESIRVWDVGLYSDEGSGKWVSVGAGSLRCGAKATVQFEKMTGTPRVVDFHASHWSAPTQCQWLAARNLAADAVDSLKIEINALVPSSFRILDADDQPTQFLGRHEKAAWGENDQGLYYRVLILRHVVDAAGMPAGTVPIGLYETGNGKDVFTPLWWPGVGSAAPGLDLLGGSLVAQILLWQDAPVANGASTESSAADDPRANDPWKALFPVDGNREPTSRILACSRQFPTR